MNIRNQAIALAGMWQSLDLIHQIAQHGILDTPQKKRFTTSLESLFIKTNDNAAAIYGGLHNIEFGLHGFAHQLEQPHKRHQVMLYIIHVLALQKRIAQNTSLSDTIAQELANLARQFHYFSSDQGLLIQNIADMYVNTLGNMPMRQRIRIYGREGNLSNPHNQSKVRTLLFCTLRSAMLWRQMGGKRYLLPFQRNTILKQIHMLM